MIAGADMKSVSPFLLLCVGEIMDEHRDAKEKAMAAGGLPEGVRILEHPADIGIEARGSTSVEAFGRAAAALLSLVVDPSTVASREQRRVSVQAADREQLLFRWLSEVLYLYDGAGFVSKEVQVTAWTPTSLEALLTGEPFRPGKHITRTDIKAVTYHQLSVWQDADGWGVRVYVDI
jgi:SHS2 domain-containing protein